MKSKELIIFFVTCWMLNLSGSLQPTLALENSNNHENEIKKIKNYKLKQEQRPPVRRTQDNEGYRPTKNENIPHIITPSGGRKTSARQPILRWQPVENTEHYTIIVRGLDWEWEKQIEGDRWWTQYTGPELEAGQTYHFIVNANNRHLSSRERFKIVDEETAQSVGEEVTQLQQSIANPEERAIAIAKLYQERNLSLDAIETLETFLENNPQTVAVSYLLICLYYEIEREDLATQVDGSFPEGAIGCSSRGITGISVTASNKIAPNQQ